MEIWQCAELTQFLSHSKNKIVEASIEFRITRKFKKTLKVNFCCFQGSLPLDDSKLCKFAL